MKKKNNTLLTTLPFIIIAVLIVVTLLAFNNGGKKTNEITTGELLSALEDKQVKSITITPKSSENVYYVEGVLEEYSDGEKFVTKVITEQIDVVVEYAEANKLEKYETNKDPGDSSILYFMWINNVFKNFI